MTYKELEKLGQNQLDEVNVYNGFAQVLLVEMLKELDLDLYQLRDETVNEDFRQQYLDNINKLAQDIPLGYVLGYEWFYGYKIQVDESVLIPRGETEELVGNILMDIDEHYPNNPVIVDIATGSGAIALTLSKELDTKVYATDISSDALKTAALNASNLKANLEIYEGDMLQPIIDRNIKVDVLVCNPPYIKNTEHIQKSVLNNEPHVALFGGNDGLYFYNQVLKNAHLILKPKGMIAFEIGFDIGEGVVNLARTYFPDAQIDLKQDLNGLDRMVFIYT